MTGATAPALRPARTHPRAHLGTLFVIVGTLLGAAMGFLVSTTLSTTFVTTTSMVLLPIPGNAYSTARGATLVNLGTEAQVARSDAVMRRVLGPDATAAEIALTRSRLRVAVSEDSDVVTLRYRAGEADRSAQVADALAVATLEVRRQRAVEARSAHLDTIQRLISRTASDLDEAETARSRRILSERLAGLRSQREQTRQLSTDPGSTLGGSTEIDTRRVLRMGVTATGAVVGAALGYLAWSAVRRRRVRRSSSR